MKIVHATLALQAEELLRRHQVSFCIGLHVYIYQKWEACSPPGHKLSRSSGRISFRNILYVIFSSRRSLDHIKAVIRKETQKVVMQI